MRGTGTPRPRPAEPAAASRRARRRAERLDPVRWSAPGRGSLLRLAAVAALLLTAAAATWARPSGCAPATRPAREAGIVAGPAPGTSDTASRPAPGTSDTASGPAPGTSGIPAGRVGVPVRLADPTALVLVRPGNRVDLLRLGAAGGRTEPVADAALVLDVRGAADPTAGALLLALSPAEAARAVAGSGNGFAILIRPG